MNLGMTGRSVLITGAYQGIGAGLARAFGAEGCTLKLVARLSEKLGALAEELHEAHGIDVEILAIDMTHPDTIERVADFAGDLDVLVNNAGSIPGGDLWEVDESSWREGWELKVFGYINFTRRIYPAMRRRGRGVILHNIGNGGENFDFNYIAGSVGNAALMAFTRGLGGRSLSNHGVRVLGINPGPVDTSRITNVLKKRAANALGDPDRYTELMSSYPLGRAATVAEVADLLVYLASDKSAYTSGAIFTVDGGISSRLRRSSSDIRDSGPRKRIQESIGSGSCTGSSACRCTDPCHRPAKSLDTTRSRILRTRAKGGEPSW